MKILTYDEVDASQVTRLTMGAFGWLLDEDKAKRIRDLDSQVSPEFAYFAEEEGRLVSMVGFIRALTETTEGEELVGWVWGVCADPNIARRGNTRALMREVHDRMRTDDIKYSFLGTSRGVVAHNLYLDLGYRMLYPLTRAFKSCQKDGKENPVSFVVVDEARCAPIFRQYSKYLLGFVHRPEGFISAVRTWGDRALDHMGVFIRDGEDIGYVVGDKAKDELLIRELCCPEISDIPSCIRALEARPDIKNLSFYGAHRRSVTEQLDGCGISTQTEAWDLNMAVDLDGEDGLEDIKRLYGIQDDRFHISEIDMY